MYYPQIKILSERFGSYPAEWLKEIELNSESRKGNSYPCWTGGTTRILLWGIPATGNKIEGSNIILMRIENGKIVEEREEADMLGLMMQLGMELKPKEGKK